MQIFSSATYIASVLRGRLEQGSELGGPCNLPARDGWVELTLMTRRHEICELGLTLDPPGDGGA